MLKKSRNFYPEEEIIDGFSILCFESHNKLDKFSSSLNKNLQRMILNEINRQKSSTIVNAKIPQSSLMSEIKSKINTTPISPTRITAQRKSKPDMNTLTLAICCKKRRNHSLSPVPHFEPKIQSIEDDSKCADKENEDINKTKIVDNVLPSCQEKICDISNESVQSKNDLYTLFNKEDSANGTSILSPVSLQPVNYLQADVEFMDLDSPSKVNSELNNLVEIVQNETVNDDIQSIDIIDPVRDEFESSLTKKQMNDTNLNKNIEVLSQLSESDDHDCIITSIGYEEAPRFSSITLSSVEHLLSEIPKLKPAPSFIPSPSIKTILLQNVHKSLRPPPLIPAPSYYFLSNLMICRTKNPIQSSKSKCISQKSVTFPKTKSPKRSLMKSSILKSSSKCVKLSSIKTLKNQAFTEKTSSPIVRSILQNTNVSNPRLFSINPLKNPNFNSMPLVNDSKFHFNKNTVQNIPFSNNRNITKQFSDSKISRTTDINRKSGIINKTSNLKYLEIRTTKNHVDIANFIFRLMKTRCSNERNNFVSLSIRRPKVQKPLNHCPYFPINQFTSINVNTHPNSISDSNSQAACNLTKKQSLYKFHNKKFSISSSLTLQNGPQTLIRPLNFVNSTFTTNSKVLMNSTVSHPINFCSRPNLLVLQ